MRGKPVILKVPAGATSMPVPGRGVTAGRPGDHGWQGCQPAILGLEGASPADAAAMAAAWALVPAGDRELFHGFCCLRCEDEEHIAAVSRITRRLRLALGPAGGAG